MIQGRVAVDCRKDYRPLETALQALSSTASCNTWKVPKEISCYDYIGDDLTCPVLVLTEPVSLTVGPRLQLQDHHENGIIAKEVNQRLFLIGGVIRLQHIVADLSGFLYVR